MIASGNMPHHFFCSWVITGGKKMSIDMRIAIFRNIQNEAKPAFNGLIWFLSLWTAFRFPRWSSSVANAHNNCGVAIGVNGSISTNSLLAHMLLVRFWCLRHWSNVSLGIENKSNSSRCSYLIRGGCKTIHAQAVVLTLTDQTLLIKPTSDWRRRICTRHHFKL